MKIKQGKPFVILSSKDRNKLVSDIMALGFKFKYVHGCYNGNQETSLLVPIHLNEVWPLFDVDALSNVARRHNQESILYVDHNRDAYLRYVQLTGDLTPLGKFVRITDSEAMDYNSWTKDTSTGQYWTAKVAA